MPVDEVLTARMRDALAAHVGITYAPAKFIASDLGTTPRSVVARMRRCGVLPLAMTAGCVGTIYERGAVPEFARRST